jgi:hypothetical protein
MTQGAYACPAPPHYAFTDSKSGLGSVCETLDFDHGIEDRFLKQHEASKAPLSNFGALMEEKSVRKLPEISTTSALDSLQSNLEILNQKQMNNNS